MKENEIKLAPQIYTYEFDGRKEWGFFELGILKTFVHAENDPDLKVHDLYRQDPRRITNLQPLSVFGEEVEVIKVTENKYGKYSNEIDKILEKITNFSLDDRSRLADADAAAAAYAYADAAAAAYADAAHAHAYAAHAYAAHAHAYAAHAHAYAAADAAYADAAHAHAHAHAHAYAYAAYAAADAAYADAADAAYADAAYADADAAYYRDNWWKFRRVFWYAILAWLAKDKITSSQFYLLMTGYNAYIKSENA